MAQYDFGITLYAPVGELRHHPAGPPVLHDLSAITCHPCYPDGIFETLPLSCFADDGLPQMSTGSASIS